MSDQFGDLGYALPSGVKWRKQKRARPDPKVPVESDAGRALLKRYEIRGYPGLNNLKPDKDCQYCGTPLAFGVTNDGKKIPLDLQAPVYAVVYDKSDEARGNVVVRTTICYVNHWSTCPQWKEAKEAQSNARRI